MLAFAAARGARQRRQLRTSTRCGAYGNNSWTAPPAAGIAADTDLRGQRHDRPARRRRRAGAARRHGAPRRSPRPTGTTIADFTLTRQLDLPQRRAGQGTRRLYAHLPARQHRVRRRGRLPGRDARPRSTPRAAGTATRRPTSSCRRSTVSRASFPALAGYTGDATTLQHRGRLLQRPAEHGLHDGRRRRRSAHLLSGPRVVLNDPTPPGASVEASGLLAGGRRNGSDAVTLDATDNGGIRRVEIVDLSGGRAGRRRPRTTAPARAPTAGAHLLAAAAPRRARTSAARPSAPTSAAGRPAHAEGPRHRHRRQRHRAAARTRSTSSRRPTAAPLNGSGATDGGTLSAHFTGSAQAGTRPSATAAGARSRGRLLNSAGHADRAARCSRVLTRDRRSGARFVRAHDHHDQRRRPLQASRCARAASRLLQVAWAVAHQRPAPAARAAT